MRIVHKSDLYLCRIPTLFLYFQHRALFSSDQCPALSECCTHYILSYRAIQIKESRKLKVDYREWRTKLKLACLFIKKIKMYNEKLSVRHLKNIGCLVGQDVQVDQIFMKGDLHFPQPTLFEIFHSRTSERFAPICSSASLRLVSVCLKLNLKYIV